MRIIVLTNCGLVFDSSPKRASTTAIGTRGEYDIGNTKSFSDTVSRCRHVRVFGNHQQPPTKALQNWARYFAAAHSLTSLTPIANTGDRNHPVDSSSGRCWPMPPLLSCKPLAIGDAVLRRSRYIDCSSMRRFRYRTYAALAEARSRRNMCLFVNRQ